MNRYYSYAITLLLSVLVMAACTNKKLENNIKSLEKRVAALEGKSGNTSSSSSTVNAVTTGSVNEADLPVMSFESIEYDFGSVNEGDIVEHTFKFTNTGKSPLVINKATATCGCTVPNWPKDPILPGGQGEIQVQFNSKNRNNLQTKYVNINANTKPEITRLKITGNVIGADS